MGNTSATTQDASQILNKKPYVFARKSPPTGFTKDLQTQVLADDWIDQTWKARRPAKKLSLGVKQISFGKMTKGSSVMSNSGRPSVFGAGSGYQPFKENTTFGASSKRLD